ncbi:MAG: Trm112 family protein [Acidobacteriota bacterium]
MASDIDQIISKELLDILACPICKTSVEPVKPVKPENTKYGLECKKCGRIYPVKDGIPIMLESEAIQKENT